MWSVKPFLILLVLLLLVALSAVRGTETKSYSPPETEDLAIIVNKSNSVDNVSLSELRKLFTAEQAYWSNGRRVTVVMREQGQPERAMVLRTIYRMSERDFNRYFLRATFTGEAAAAPKTVSTATSVRKFVLNVPGAIGYVRGGEVDGSVKVIKVDGHAPGAFNYPLRIQR